MKLTVDCALTHQLLALPQDSALAQLLSRANIVQLDLPLQALVCDQHGLKPMPDYPIAAIAASADGLDDGDAYWLRADPVHLVLQRDSFSLSEPVPLQAEREQAEQVVASLNQHFSQNGLAFFIGNSGAWYLRLNHAPQIQTTLPNVAIGRSVYQFMPQGVAATAWVSYLNEVQMLLHDHPVNVARESAGEVAINSIWLSGGGAMPQALSSVQDGKDLHGTDLDGIDLIVASSPFYQGLAKWSGLPNQQVSESVADMLQRVKSQQHVRLELPEHQLLDDARFHVLWNALQTRSIQQLRLNLGCYEKTLVATIRPIDTYKFWRKNKPISTYLT